MTAGIINFLKPTGMTSHDAVSFIRRTYGLKRVGHAGTLDPAAVGVLPIALGQSTRVIEYMTDCDKAYRAEITFGYSTDTGDDTGTIITRGSNTLPSQSEIVRILETFLGDTFQVPPMYSAIKIAGKKMYELARAGIEVERQPRKITIKAIRLVHSEQSRILIDVICSKGTYIRTLCSDIGEKLGCPAVMSFLVRTRVGALCLEQACTLEEISQNPTQALLPTDVAIQQMPIAVLSADNASFFRHGRSIKYQGDEQSLFRVYNSENILLGIARKSAEELIPVKILFPHEFQAN